MLKSDTLENKKFSFRGKLEMQGDKSICIRALILSSFLKAESHIENMVFSEDIKSTISLLKDLGTDIRPGVKENSLIIKGGEYIKPKKELFAGNSATLLRLMSGVLSAAPFSSSIHADESLMNRPMNRIINPLREMGARISGSGENGDKAAIYIRPSLIKDFSYELPIASAQLKSSLIFSALKARRSIIIKECPKSRDHTERMLKFMGSKIDVRDYGNGRLISLPENDIINLENFVMKVPGDVSSAAFMILGALLLEDSLVEFSNLLLSPGRSEYLDVLKSMGADITIYDKKTSMGEITGSVRAKYSHLKPLNISGSLIPLVIDEIPMLSFAAAFADGVSEIRDAEELRHKESDRIKLICYNLNMAGVKTEEFPDGLRIYGDPRNIERINNGFYITAGDHRIAMCLKMIKEVSSADMEIDDTDCINVSYPEFQRDMESIKV